MQKYRGEKKYRRKNYWNIGKIYRWHIKKHSIHETGKFYGENGYSWKIRNGIICKNTLEKILSAGNSYIFNRFLEQF